MSLESDLKRIQEEINARRAKVVNTFRAIERDLEARAAEKGMSLKDYRKLLEQKSKDNIAIQTEVREVEESPPVDLNGWDWAAHHYEPTGKWSK